MILNVRKPTLTYAPNEDSNQPAHPRSPIKVFDVRMKKFYSLGFQNVLSEDSDQTVQILVVNAALSRNRHGKVRKWVVRH